MKITIYDTEEHNNSKYIIFSRCFKLILINYTDLAFRHSDKAHLENIYDFNTLVDLDKVVGGRSHLMRYKNFA